MQQKLNRTEVFALIEGERSYQETRWNKETTTSEGNHSWEEWITYIEHYLRKAKDTLSTKPKQEADLIAADTMRKVASLTVAAMENLGAPARVVPVKS